MQTNNLSTLDEISSYRRRHSAASLIVDTNVFLLFLVGNFDLNYLKQCPLMTDNGKNYNREHFELMQKVLSLFLYQVTLTPHILSEINMLSRKRIKPGIKIDDFFKKIIEELKKCHEQQVEMEMILKNGGVIKFGFTDISLIEAATKHNGIILTDEFNLYQTYREQIPVIYFRNIVAHELYRIPV